MKQLEKMSLANVRNKLTRKEMSNIMAGSGSDICGGNCILYVNGSNHPGVCWNGGPNLNCRCYSYGGNYAETCRGI